MEDKCIVCGEPFVQKNKYQLAKTCGKKNCIYTLASKSKRDPLSSVKPFCKIKYVNCMACGDLLVISVQGGKYPFCRKDACLDLEQQAKIVRNNWATNKYYHSNLEQKRANFRNRYSRARQNPKKPSPHSFHLTYEQKEKVLRLGGSAWLRKVIDEAPEP